MIITVLNEQSHDSRVALVPSSISSLIELGFDVFFEPRCGLLAGFTDESYQNAGAKIILDREETLHKTNILVRIDHPTNTDELKSLPAKSLVIGQFSANPDNSFLKWCCTHHISVAALNLLPATRRTREIDCCTPAENLRGYRAVIEAANYYIGSLSTIMTAVGSVLPATILVLGTDVASLQAIATARRLGAMVLVIGTDPLAQEQIENLGAEFILAENSEFYIERIHQYLPAINILICSDQLDGHIIEQTALNQMKPGSVIIDLVHSKSSSLLQAVQPIEGVTLIQSTDLIQAIPYDASLLYSKNLVHFIRLIAESPGSLVFNPTDEIIKRVMLCYNGKFRPFLSKK